MFSLADLRTEATPASFSRGRAYFEGGAVGRIRRRDDKDGSVLFSARVSGSADYTVELTLSDGGEDDPDFWCDCPYNYEGICKHCVALGLAVLEEFGPAASEPPAPRGRRKTQKAATRPAARIPEPAPNPAPAASPTAAAPKPKAVPNPVPAPAEATAPRSAAELEAALREVSKPEKVKFLELHLRQNPVLARAFLTHFYGPPAEPDPLDNDPTLPRPDLLRDELRRALGRLRFDPPALADEQGRVPPITWGFGAGVSRFMSPLRERIAAVLAPVLEPVAAAIGAALAAGRLAEAVRRWQGAWQGIALAARPAADPYYLFQNQHYAPQVAEAWLRLLTEMDVERQLREQPFSAAEVARCAPVLARPLLPAPRPAPRRPGQSAAPALPDADPVLLRAAATNPSLAPALRTLLQPHWTKLPMPVRLALAAGTRDWAAWEPLAAHQADFDPAVALALLEFYRDHHRRTDLLRAGSLLFARYPLVVGPFVLAHVPPAEHRSLYVRALTQRLHRAQNFADYEELAPLWTPKERAEFVQKLVQRPGQYGWSNPFGALFRGRVLAAEGRAAEVLALALALDWRPRPGPSYRPLTAPDDLADLPELLALAARPDPEATLDAVMERIEQYLADKAHRPVELYEHLSRWLQALHELPALTDQVLLFAEGLAELHPKLFNLRRALRAAQLLPEPEPNAALRLPLRPPKAPAKASGRPGRKPRNPLLGR